jgi:hypothetical protein
LHVVVIDVNKVELYGIFLFGNFVTCRSCSELFFFSL